MSAESLGNAGHVSVTLLCHWDGTTHMTVHAMALDKEDARRLIKAIEVQVQFLEDRDKLKAKAVSVDLKTA